MEIDHSLATNSQFITLTCQQPLNKVTAFLHSTQCIEVTLLLGRHVDVLCALAGQKNSIPHLGDTNRSKRASPNESSFLSQEGESVLCSATKTLEVLKIFFGNDQNSSATVGLKEVSCPKEKYTAPLPYLQRMLEMKNTNFTLGLEGSTTCVSKPSQKTFLNPYVRFSRVDTYSFMKGPFCQKFTVIEHSNLLSARYALFCEGEHVNEFQSIKDAKVGDSIVCFPTWKQRGSNATLNFYPYRISHGQNTSFLKLSLNTFHCRYVDVNFTFDAQQSPYIVIPALCLAPILFFVTYFKHVKDTWSLNVVPR